MNINNKIVVVFGGTSGIGKAVCQALVKKKAAKVYAISRNPKKYKNIKKSIKLVELDVLDEDALKTFFKNIGKFDVLINTATGGERAIGPFKTMDLNGFRNSFRKLWGYTNTVKYGLKQLKNSGCIVLVSGSPARKAKKGQIALASVGGAVEAFSKTLASEIKPKRINVISPGVIDTPMTTLTGNKRKQLYKDLTKDNLIPRAGSASEVSEAIIFAIENEFITGTIIDVDGGWISSL